MHIKKETRHSVTISIRDVDDFTVECYDYEVSEGCLHMRLSPAEETGHYKCFPICNVLEITMREAE